MAIIALATDFGDGPYVGQMKAVLEDRNPGGRVIDLFHTVSPQAVLEGAFLLSRTWPFFPKKTILVAVVDPEVGSKRKILAVRAWDRIFLAPDNGLLSFIPPSAIREARTVENRSFFLTPVSATFHGRDIFAPVAAALARGVALDRFGPRVRSLRTLNNFFPGKTSTGLTGSIVHIDRFGNAVTNIPANLSIRSFTIGRRKITRTATTYAASPDGKPVAIRGSFDTWEIAVRNGNAARRLGLKIGQAVRKS